MAINRVTIMGNLTRDAELRKKGDATSVLTFGLAINEKKKDSETGEYVDAPVLLWKEMDGSCSGLQFKLRMASTNQQQRRKRAPFMVSVRLSRRDWKESLSSLQRN